MNQKINEIDPEKFYSASEICRRGWFLWKMTRSMTLFLSTDEGRRIFNPVVITKGAVKRYQIKGSAIREALGAIDAGTLQINHSS